MESHQYVKTDSLEKWAEAEAGKLPYDAKISLSDTVVSLTKALGEIDRAALKASGEKGKGLTGAFEWLLDNRYLCKREGQGAYAELIGTGKLPACSDMPYVYELCRLLVGSDPSLGNERISLFLEGTQKTRGLSERELWCFIPMLKTVIIQEIALIARQLRLTLDSLKKTPRPDAESYSRQSSRIGALITSLRFLSVADFTVLLQSKSVMEKILCRDPAGLYDKMDEESRTHYRTALSRIAEKRGISEEETANKIILMCKNSKTSRERHVGFYLFEKPFGRQPSRLPRFLYFAAFITLTVAPSVLCAWVSGSIWSGLLLLIPFSGMSKNIADTLTTRLIPPRPIPRLALKEGLPTDGKTLCVISAILADEKKGVDFARKIEAYRQANRDSGKNLIFGLLCDLPDSKKPPGEAQEKVFQTAFDAVARLNDKYGGDFYLFTRQPQFVRADKKYMGKERKRGAVLELCRFLRGRESGVNAHCGSLEYLQGVKYVITLDSDTVLTPGSARLMVGSMMHGQNKPVMDEKKGVVKHGYGLLAPRMAVDLEAAGKSLFSRIFAGQGGLDPYSGMTGEVYHDLFNSGNFTGKGIFDVDIFLQCLDDRFPEMRILSHDLLEGAYLGAGLLEDVELSDGYPSGFLPWSQRLHRWTRGDWQTASWMLSSVPLPGGGKEKNPLSGISRFKLFDTLRRSVVPVFTWLALTIGALLPGKTFVLLFSGALISTISHLLIEGFEALFRRRRGKIRYHTAIITGGRAVLYQTVLLLLFLPYQAFVSMHAIIASMWRLSVSKRNLLEWVTAEQTESFSFKSIEFVRKMFPGMILGVLTACLSANPGGWVLGVGWALSPFIAYAVSQPKKQPTDISGTDKDFLMHQAKLMWQYFEDYLRREDNFLIPDNWQETPAAGLARRSSPTNIGLSLLCALAAADLGLCTKECAKEIIGSILNTVEGLPKWHGHIYNWYNTRTLEPLSPRCVSTVDSGNLCGYLIALRQGLLEWPHGAELAERAEKLYSAIDFTPLYDPERRLFVICRDMDNPDSETGYYDLLASEARQTSYISTARGEVDKKHWQRLGRAQTALGWFRGMASWTGTMFEYFMPHLLLPVYDNSLLRESLDFAVYAQREQSAKWGGPWGASESCFYSFDPALNYQYKAHGTPALAFKRGLGKDWVVSPYSSFLSLLTHPHESVKNLRRFQKLGTEGKYGLIESVDFTPSRRASLDKKFEEVRCYMSHHLGMSLIAVCNALKENIMQKRFMRDAEMGAFSGLLQERVPVGAATIKPAGREVPEKSRMGQNRGGGLARSELRPGAPAIALLGNNAYNLLCTDTGMSRSVCRGQVLTRFLVEDLGRAHGIRFLFASQDKTHSLIAGQNTCGLEAYSALFEGHRVCWSYDSEGFSSRISAYVPENETAERRTVRLENKTEKVMNGILCVYFEPVLQSADDFEAHPCFSKLFLETQIEDSAVLVRRRPRENQGEFWLCFSCDTPNVQYDTSREKALGRGGADVLEYAAASPSGNTQGAVLDPCVLARVPVKILPGMRISVTFALSCGQSASDALTSAKRVCARSESAPIPGGTRHERAARHLDLAEGDAAQAIDWLPALTLPFFRTGQSHEGKEGRFADIEKGLRLGLPGLWVTGISGDEPIVLITAFDADNLSRLGKTIRQHRYLSLCGFSCDLAILCKDGGDYRRPVRTFVMETLKTCNSEGFLSAKGGVHLCDLTVLPQGSQEALYANARIVIGESLPVPVVPETEEPLPLCPNFIPGKQETVPFQWLDNGAFQFGTTNNLPPLAWSHILSNRGFGALVTETGSGFSFWKNSRENKITPWNADPLTAEGGVTLKARIDDKSFSLFASQDNIDCTVTYGAGWACWEKSIGQTTVKTTQFVPHERMALVTLIEISSVNEPVVLQESRILLSDGHKTAGTILFNSVNDRCITAENPKNLDFAPQCFVFAASLPIKQIPALPGVLKVSMSLQAGVDGVWRAVLISGGAANAPGVSLLQELATLTSAERAFEATKAYWETLCRDKNLPHSQIDDPGGQALGRYMSSHALYQVIAGRLFARTSLYQCGGAYGFRDQLQDSCAALHTQPKLTRTQILRACAHQYLEGDVMHWWHPLSNGGKTGGRGVRTRCSDDLLWLPYTVCEYLEKAKDSALLDQMVPFLASEPLSPDAGDRYETAVFSDEHGSVYEHCHRAVDLVLTRGTGIHGLCLIGSGDWNDGMNLVGAAGRGESVWLTWFCAHVLERFAPICRTRGDTERAEWYLTYANRLTDAALSAWDGEWFLRGFYDNGEALGGSASQECRIDSIAQSFSALFPDRIPFDKVHSALNKAKELLVDEKHGIVKVLDPPFSGKSPQDPGYIKGYLPGVRENGGQYTHAAVWLAMGFLRIGDLKSSREILTMLLPETHDPAIYKAEPYMLAADVYAHEQHLGRGGWSLYTGAAAWYYRIAKELLEAEEQ
ncbi:MAG: hypothetical protein FWH04_09255 [Oscillospiraceae bacterium]|nr:hypothetical protein [Oscillospiraceae bacterium]